MVASGFRSRWLSWALLRWPRSAARSALGWSALFSRLCPCVCCFCLLSGPLSSRPLWLVRQLPSVPSGPRHQWQGPRCAVRVAASCATHTPGSRCTEPLPGSWTHPQRIPGSNGPVWGPRVCTRLWSGRARRAVLSQRGPVRARLGPGHLRWRTLAAGPIPGAAGQLPDLPLRAPPGQPQAPGGPSLGVGSPRPRGGDDRGLYPQGLEEVLQAPDGPAECCAAMLWALSPASSRPLVAPQLPVVRVLT